MSSISPAASRRSFKLHKAILGTSLALSAFGLSDVQRAHAQVVTLTANNQTGAGVATVANVTAATLNLVTFNLDGGATPTTQITGAAGGLTITGTTGTSTIGVPITGAAGGVTFNVAGATTKVFLVNGGASTYTSGTTISAAAGGSNTVRFAIGQASTSYTLSDARSTMRLDADNIIVDTATIALGGGTLDLRATDTVGTISGGGAITFNASDTLTFGGATNGTISANITDAGVNVGNLIKAGTGTQTLSGTNNLAGTVTVNAGQLTLSGTNTFGGTIVNRGATLNMGANGALAANNNLTINNGGTVNLGGFTTNNLNVTANFGSTVRDGALAGTVTAQGATFSNVSGSAALNLNGGANTLSGTNSFGNIALNGGTTTVAVPTGGIPITSTGTVSAGGGTLSLDASALTRSEVEGDKTIVAGNVDDSVAASTTFTFGGRTERFAGFNKPLEGVGLYDIQLKKGSIILSVQRKGAEDICGVTGLCTTGKAEGNLEGLDRTEVRSLYGKVVLPALQTGRLDLPFWTTNTQISKYLISGLMPRNVDAAGTVLSSYNDRMADTLFERLPLRQFEPVEVAEEEIVIEEVETKEPVRGLWKTTAEGEVLEVNGETYQEDTSLTAQYTKRDGMRAWVRGFGGDVAAAQSTKYLYKEYTATNSGGVVGVDYAAFDDFQVGVYANYGDLAISTDGNKYAGSGSWSPTGWGGGITADYWTDSYYVQGLFGASAFSGDQDRSIVAIGGDLGGGNTLSGNKNVTSFVGALRAGAPLQVGSFYLEPQAQATWSGNQEDAFNEGGNSNFRLKYKSRQTNFLQTELGIKVAYPIALGSTKQLVPSVRVAWLGDWNMNNEGQKIGYRFSNKSIDLDSYQKDQNGALLEGGLDYTVANIGATSFKVYGRGGAEVWDTDRGTNWRASGGVTVQF